MTFCDNIDFMYFLIDLLNYCNVIFLDLMLICQYVRLQVSNMFITVMYTNHQWGIFNRDFRSAVEMLSWMVHFDPYFYILFF